MRVLCLAVAAALAACRADPPRDIEADRAEIARLLQLERTAHVEHRADLLAAAFADAVLMFHEWDDIEPPRIRVSPDGGMAYAIVSKRVRLTAPDSTGAAVAEHRVFALMELYEKLDGRWRLMAVASTDRAGGDG